jgi:hypothetical protein
MTTYHKPGTQQFRVAGPDDAEFLKNFGWEPLAEPKTSTKKKTETPEPAVEEEVGHDDNQGD